MLVPPRAQRSGLRPRPIGIKRSAPAVGCAPGRPARRPCGHENAASGNRHLTPEARGRPPGGSWHANAPTSVGANAALLIAKVWVPAIRCRATEAPFLAVGASCRTAKPNEPVVVASSPAAGPVRVVLAGLVLFGLFAGFLNFLTKIRPLDTWFFVQLARIWAYDAYLTLACASFGLRFVRYCGLRNLAFLERLAYALPCGLIAFVVGMYVGGFLGWYGALFALALPACLLLVGCFGSRTPGEAPLFDHALRPAPSIASLAAAGFGVGCIGLLYLGILTPDAVNYDASWNHLVIAQDYARAGRIHAAHRRLGEERSAPRGASSIPGRFSVPGLDEAGRCGAGCRRSTTSSRPFYVVVGRCRRRRALARRSPQGARRLGRDLSIPKPVRLRRQHGCRRRPLSGAVLRARHAGRPSAVGRHHMAARVAAGLAGRWRAVD